LIVDQWVASHEEVDVGTIAEVKPGVPPRPDLLRLIEACILHIDGVAIACFHNDLPPVGLHVDVLDLRPLAEEVDVILLDQLIVQVV